MPIYTYRCENCGVQFDEHQSFTDPSLTICPKCKMPALRKVFLPVGIVFKGSGFYATDHRSPSGQSRLGSEKGDKNGDKPVEKPTETADAKKESKPPSKTTETKG